MKPWLVRVLVFVAFLVLYAVGLVALLCEAMLSNGQMTIR